MLDRPPVRRVFIEIKRNSLPLSECTTMSERPPLSATMPLRLKMRSYANYRGRPECCRHAAARRDLRRVMCHKMGTKESVTKTSPCFVTTRSLSMPAPKLRKRPPPPGRDVVDGHRAREPPATYNFPRATFIRPLLCRGARNELPHQPSVERS